MKKLVWVATMAAVALWSAIAWALHGLVGVAGNVVSSNSDFLPVSPEIVEWTSWLALFGTGVAEWLVISVWALVTLVLLGLGFLGGKLVSSGRLPGRFANALDSFRRV